jgi:hypothetical protein
VELSIFPAGMSNMKDDFINEHRIKVAGMWNWFTSISNKLFLNPTDPDLIHTLDGYISGLGPFDWEIGPYDKSALYLAISPNLKEGLLKETKAIIGLSPACEGWSFLFSKPAKEWIGTWEMLNEAGETIVVNADRWAYVLYQFEDNTFDMDVKIDSVKGDFNTCQLAVDIALTNVLGEEMYMDAIKNVSIENVEHLEEGGSRSLVKNLKEHMLQLGKK